MKQTTVFEATKPTDKIVSTSVSFAGGHDLEMSDNEFINTFRCHKGKEAEKTILAHILIKSFFISSPCEGVSGVRGNRNPRVFGPFDSKRTLLLFAEEKLNFICPS